MNGNSLSLFSDEPNGVVDFVGELIGLDAVAPLAGVLSMFADLEGLLLALLEHASDELDEGEPGENFELLELAYARLRRESALPSPLKARAERLLREGWLQRQQVALVNYYG